MINISLGEKVYSRNGNGSGICIILTKQDGRGCGLGDHIQSLPVIYELVKTQKVTIYANEFYRKLYERAGCEFFNQTKIYYGCTEDLAENFAVVYSMIEWSIDEDSYTGGNAKTDRTSLFASYFGLERPKEFDYVKALNAKKRKESKTIYAPESSSSFRQFPRSEQLYHKLKEEYPNLVWLGSKSSKQLYEKDFQALVNMVYSADAVFSVDNGIMHLASALGTPVFAVFGGTDEKVVCEPYEVYKPDGKRLYFRANPSTNECQAPCSHHSNRGFWVNGKCKEFSDCMVEIKHDFILSEFRTFQQTN